MKVLSPARPSLAVEVRSCDIVHSPLPRRPVRRRPFALLFCLAAVLLFARLPCGLLEPEEARYAEIARQMLEQGRWLTPTLHGEDYLHKPPLLYWLIMVSYSVFGVQDWAARLVPCLAGLGVVAACYFWARSMLGRRGAFCGVLALMLSGRFLYLQGMILFDGLLCLWVTLGLAWGHAAFHGRKGGFRWRWWFASAVACALGILTKGPVAAALIGPPLLFMWWVRGGRGRGNFSVQAGRPHYGRLGAAYGLTIALLCLPWFAHLVVRHPEAAREFFLLHHLQRYVDPFDHAKPWWFFLAPLVFGMLPWSLWGGKALRAGWRTLRRGALAAMLSSRAAPFWITGCWCVLFFSLSGCKRAAYVLPAFGPLAVALGHQLRKASADTGRTFLCAASSKMGKIACSTLLVLLAGTLFWLPAYHAHFGMREALTPVRQMPNIPVYSYPRTWDSVAFYTGQPRRGYAGSALDELIAQLEREETAWLIVRRRDGLRTLMERWPGRLRFQVQGPEHPNVIVGLVMRKN